MRNNPLTHLADGFPDVKGDPTYWAAVSWAEEDHARGSHTIALLVLPLPARKRWKLIKLECIYMQIGMIS